MAEWQTQTRVLRAGRASAAPVIVQVDTLGGSVVVQLQNSSGAWFTPADAEYTLDADDVFTIERADMPECRLVANGSAQFKVMGA